MPRTARTRTLTAIAVKRYAEGPPTSKELHDGGGLYLRRRASVCQWYLRLTDPQTGANQWHRMFQEDPQGAYPHKSLAEARDEAARLWEIRRHGIDPRVQRIEMLRAQQLSAEAVRTAEERRITLRKLFDRWVNTELQPRIRTDGKRAGRKDAGKFAREQFERRVFPKLGAVPVEQVRKSDLLAILDEVRAEGKLRTANVLFSDLKQMFRFALTREIVDRNPLDTVARRDVGGASVERSRVLSPDEVHLLVPAIAASGLQIRSAIALWLILATGARIGELMGAVWADAERELSALRLTAEAHEVKLGFVDLASRSWKLLDTKSQRDHTIHLSSFAVRQFEHLAALREVSIEPPHAPVPWIFPNTKGTGPVSVKSIGKQLGDRQRPLERRMQHRTLATTSLVLPGGRWTAHDLRRTAATFMAELGISGDVIDECLNHVIESQVRRVYIRNRREADQARAFDALGDRLGEIVASCSIG